MILGAQAAGCSARIPAAVYGYAATAGLFLLGGAGYGERRRRDPQGRGRHRGVAASSAPILGYISEKIAGAVAKA